MEAFPAVVFGQDLSMFPRMRSESLLVSVPSLPRLHSSVCSSDGYTSFGAVPFCCRAPWNFLIQSSLPNSGQINPPARGHSHLDVPLGSDLSVSFLFLGSLVRHTHLALAIWHCVSLGWLLNLSGLCLASMMRK